MLYRVGGGGDLPSNWIYDGRANLIMDNLICLPRARRRRWRSPFRTIECSIATLRSDAELTFNMFEAELRKHVNPLVESQYSVRNDPPGRALAGLSMGGRHTQFVGQGAFEADAPLGARCVALHQASLKHGVRHEYYAG